MQFCRGIFHSRNKEGKGRKQQVIIKNIAHTQRIYSFFGHLCSVSRRKEKRLARERGKEFDKGAVFMSLPVLLLMYFDQ